MMIMSSQVFDEPKRAAVVGLVLVVPFVILELVFAQTSYSNFPFPLFAFLWLIAAVFTWISIGIVRALPGGSRSRVRPTTLILGALVLVIIASMWGGIVIDQLPCFLGVPNCD